MKVVYIFFCFLFVCFLSFFLHRYCILALFYFKIMDNWRSRNFLCFFVFFFFVFFYFSPHFPPSNFLSFTLSLAAHHPSIHPSILYILYILYIYQTRIASMGGFTIGTRAGFEAGQEGRRRMVARFGNDIFFFLFFFFFSYIYIFFYYYYYEQSRAE